MKRGLRTVAVVGLLLALAACTSGAPREDAEPTGEWIDLTHTLGAETIFWPTAEPYVHEQVFAGTTDAGYYYSTYNLALSEHGGTHLDAPVHFAEGRQSADQVPLDRLIGPAAVIDVTAAAAADADYRVTREDVLAWEADNEPLPKGAIVLVRTGFASRWPDAARYLGTTLKGDEGVAALHFPGLSEGAARLLAEERSIAAVGIDTASIDYGQSQDYIAH
jgi:kynurenine formamidase